MNRRFTNMIRYFMDEWLPPAIRDTRWFMYPFFLYAYKGKNIRETMHLKSSFFKWPAEKVAAFYRDRDTRFSCSRNTDLSELCIRAIFERLPKGPFTLLDVGCGKGFFCLRAKDSGYRVTGCDVIPEMDIPGCDYVSASVEKLPFPDDSFDIVTCSHTLEHVVDFRKAVDELKRVARSWLVVVVPSQRAYYYTLDEHVRFFPYKYLLEQEMQMRFYSCEKISGDLLFIGNMTEEKASGKTP